MSKNVTVNGVDYTGVSQVQLPTTAGGTALFKDVDEITDGGVSIWEGYQHTMQVAPIPYIIDQCEKATAKGTLTPTAAMKGTTELVNTGLSAIHCFVIMLKTPVDSASLNGNPIQMAIVDVDKSVCSKMVYSTNAANGTTAVADGKFGIGANTQIAIDGGTVNVVELYNGDQYSALRSTNEYLWFAW